MTLVLHATTVAIGGRGVLILGPSGSGKSGLALELMAMGAGLVADDRTEISRVLPGWAEGAGGGGPERAAAPRDSDPDRAATSPAGPEPGGAPADPSAHTNALASRQQPVQRRLPADPGAHTTTPAAAASPACPKSGEAPAETRTVAAAPSPAPTANPAPEPAAAIPPQAPPGAAPGPAPARPAGAALPAPSPALFASCPPALLGLIEARGVGILRTAPHPPCPLALVIDLGRVESARLPAPRTVTLLDVTLPLLHKADTPRFAAAILAYMLGGRHDDPS